MQRLLCSTALLAVAGLTACGESTPPPLPETQTAGASVPPELLDPEVPEGPEIVPEGDPPVPPDREELRQAQEERREQMDEHGRGLLGSFEGRVYTPPREGELRFAEGVARVRVGESEAAFRITFDAERPAGERVSVITEQADDALPDGTGMQVAGFAQMALEGPYRFVVQYLPPIQLWLTLSKDRKYKIVTAPSHKHDVQVSYRFDERELISHRGISVLPAAEITNYEWTFWRGRYLLSRFWVHGTGATCDFEYDDREAGGVTLLRRALVRKEDRAFDVAFEWERVESGAPEER